jgi:transposase
MRCRKRDPMVEWARQIEKRRGKKVAAIALVRKLAGVLYAMWRDGKPYDPQHASKATTGSGMAATPIVP